MDDPSGDGGIAVFFGAIAPSFVLAVGFLVAAGIKYLITRSL
jgi:Flp pilus assembly protein TadG